MKSPPTNRAKYKTKEQKQTKRLQKERKSWETKNIRIMWLSVIF